MKNKNYVTRQFGFNLNEPDKQRALQFLEKCSRRQATIISLAVCEFLDKHGIEEFDYDHIKFFLEQYEKLKNSGIPIQVDTTFNQRSVEPQQKTVETRIHNDIREEFKTQKTAEINISIEDNVVSSNDKECTKEIEQPKQKNSLLVEGAGDSMKKALQMFGGM